MSAKLINICCLCKKKDENFCRAIGIAAFRSRPWLDLRKARRWNDFLECPQGTARAQRLRRQNHYNASPKRNWYQSERYWNQITPETLIEKASRYGNFSQPMYNVSKASVPSVRCSRRSSSDSASFSPPLSLRKPLRPRLTPAA